MKSIVFFISIAIVFSSCGMFRHTSEVSCPANVTQESNPNIYSTGQSSSCPANVVRDEKNNIANGPHSSCPPSAFGAEKILAFLDKKEKQLVTKHPTAKGDPVTGKKTSQAKGYRTGELERPKKMTKAQKKADKKKKREDRALERQIQRDIKEANKPMPPY